MQSGQPHVDPFKVARDPGLFREHLTSLIKAVAEQFAKDLQPEGRRGVSSVQETNEGGDVSTPRKNERKQEESEDLPSPD